MSAAHDASHLFVEIGAAILLLAILARLANRWCFSAIPLYLLAGLAFGNGGLAPLPLSQGFIGTGAEIGVLLLLFMLGLEYSGEDLKKNLRFGLPAGIVDLLLNFTPGLVTGFLLKWKPMAAVLLGGITYISSSGVIAKVLEELKRINNAETPTVLAVLVLEDLAMAAYLPLVGVLLLGGGPTKIAISVSVAVAVVLLVLFVALKYGRSSAGSLPMSQTKSFCSQRLEPCYSLLVWLSGSRYRRPSARFWLASRYPDLLPNNRIGFWLRCAICLLRLSSSFSDCRSIPPHCPLRSPSR